MTMADEKDMNPVDGEDLENELTEGEEQEHDATAGGPEQEEDGAEACEPEEGCEDPAEADAKGKGKGKNAGANKTKETKPAQAAKPAPAAPNKDKFKYPFNVRYATEFLDLAGFVDGTEYTGAQVKEILIANGYTEFADMEPAFHRSEATNTIVITIQGSKKGGGYHGR